MPQPPIMGGRVLNGGPSQVTVTDIRILEPAALQFQRGGCDRPGADFRAEIVDIPRQTMFMLPFNIQYAETLHKQLGELIDTYKLLEG